MPATRKPGTEDGPPGKHVVLILSSDPVAAALIGALVETLGYLVRFYAPPETPDAAIRRARPSVAMIDCGDPTLLNAELLGRATMRGISVLVFGSTAAIDGVRRLVTEHDLDALIMPATLDALDESLRRAVEKLC
jgi:DNA-binding NtrC family response regulator